MAETFSCPECGKVLKSSNPLAPGKKVKCPSCAAVFTPAAAKAVPAKAAAAPKKAAPNEATAELPKTKPSPAPAAAAGAKKPTRPAPADEDNPDDLGDEDLPRHKAVPPAKKPAPPDDDLDFEDEPPPPKAKAGLPPKKPAPVDDDLDFDDEPPAVKSKGGPPPKKPAPIEDDLDFDDEPLPAKGKAPSPKMPAPLEDDLDFEDEPLAAKGKGAPPPKKPVPVEDDLDFEDEPAPVKGKGGPPPKKPMNLDLDDLEDVDDDDLPPAKSKNAVQAKKPGPKVADGPPLAKPNSVQAKKPAPKVPAKPGKDFGFDDEDDDLPAAKGKKGPPPKKGKPRDDDDEDDDDEDDDDRPSKKKGKKAKAQSKTMLYALIGGGVGLVLIFLVTAFLWPGFLLSKPDLGPIKSGGKEQKIFPAPDGPSDPLLYVPAESIALMGLNMPKARDGKGTGDIIKMVSTQLGADPDPAKAKAAGELLNALDKVVVAQLPERGKSGQQKEWVIFSFSADAEMKNVLDLFDADAVADKEFYKGTKGFLAQPVKKVVVVGDMDQADFERHLGVIGKAGTLAKEMKAEVDLVKDAFLWMTVQNAPDVKKGLGGMLGNLEKDEKLKMLAPIFGPAQRFKTASVEVRDSGGGLKIKGRMDCANEADAKTVEQVVSLALKLGLPLLLDAQVAPLEGKIIPAGLSKNLKSMLGTVRTGIDKSQTWATLDVTVENMKNLQILAMVLMGPPPGVPPGPPPMFVPMPVKVGRLETPLGEVVGAPFLQEMKIEKNRKAGG